MFLLEFRPVTGTSLVLRYPTEDQARLAADHIRARAPRWLSEVRVVPPAEDSFLTLMERIRDVLPEDLMPPAEECLGLNALFAEMPVL